jgi:hypothetical protein
MAIFIVDQFSLNTDLPLDIRYVPNGGTYFDVSMYWYPGMQVYQTLDQKIWYADNSLNWHMVGQGADGSLNALYQYFNDLSTYVYQQIPSINASISALQSKDASLDASINYLWGWQLSQDVSISKLISKDASLDASINYLWGWQLSQDASISALVSRDASIDASLNYLFNWNLLQDTSINALVSKDASIDASLNYLWGWNISQDASISALISKDSSLDASIALLNSWQISQDASISALRSKDASLDASLGLFVLKAGDTMTGPLTITGGGGLVVNTGDVSIFGKLFVQGDTNIGGDLTINGSLYVINTGTLDVSTGFVRLNTGLTGTPAPSMQAGIVIERGVLEPYVIIYDETGKTFRIGIASETSTGYLDSSTQAVATRQDSPITDGIAYWNNILNRFDTSVGLTYDGKSLYVDGSVLLPKYAGGGNLMLIVDNDGTVKAVAIPNYDVSINDLYSYIDGSLLARDNSISWLVNKTTSIDASISALVSKDASLDASINKLFTITTIIDASIVRIDSSINALFARKDTSVLGAINIGDGSAGVYAGITADGSLRFREFVGTGAATVYQNGDLIEIGLDGSFGGEVNTASNISGGDASIFSRKVAQDLQFKEIKSLDSSMLIITSDASFVYFDLSIGAVSVNASLGGLTDVSIIAPLKTHQVVEYNASVGKWINTDNIFWDISLGTTTDDLGGIPQGTDLNSLTLKEILFRILYEYQKPTLVIGSNPLSGVYEKGLVSTQFSSIDVSWYSTNTNYPLALLNNVHITKTGVGSIFDASLGLVASNASTYTDLIGITNWGGTNRTISYNVTIDDNQSGMPQPAVGLTESFTFWYRQYWGMVAGTTNLAAVNSPMIKGLKDSSVRGEVQLTATFDNSTGGFVKYLFAYPDTVASPDNFGILAQILDQNDFDITSSFETKLQDVSIGLNNVRYRAYLLKNKVDTSIFNITFKF